MSKVLKDPRYVSRRQQRRQINEEYRKLCNTNVISSVSRHIPATVCTSTDTKSDAAEFNSSNITTDLQLNSIDSDNIALSKPIHGHNVPLDARTLLQAPRKLEIIDMSPGHYYHFGLVQGSVRSVAKYYSTENCPKELQININVDGLPLTKSSGSQFWPILASVEADFYTEPFIVGLYHGSNEFMKYFTEECSKIIDVRLSIGNRTVPIKINAFVSDTPAKCFITGTKGHNAYFGCGKWVQEGEFIDNRVTYPETTARLRTNESFRLKTNEEHHKKTSILENLCINMILDFPIDYMHLVCLGVMKKLLQFWIKGSKDVRMTNFQRKRASDLLLLLNKSISKEFARKARPLEEVDRFKATELRQLLLYTGPIVFRDNLPRDKYNHFLCLSVAIRILASPEYHIKLNDYARELLQYFVESFPSFYGHQHISYNVHNFIYLCDDVKLKGPLDKFSAFKFENYMQKIRKSLRTSSKPLQQLIKRNQEECIIDVQYEKFEYPIIKYAIPEEINEGKNTSNLFNIVIFL
ncbi:uncharacterized protein LOC124406298 [Diprion similis]|uniref:uncharacterized protein LOC124406298 n=1 Tax=Diprion similis TaxID=362088 RepID=UPI001EF7C665|nr:uncharacterized protein LOC124406298 [Diprion similis]